MAAALPLGWVGGFLSARCTHKRTLKIAKNRDKKTRRRNLAGRATHNMYLAVELEQSSYPKVSHRPDNDLCLQWSQRSGTRLPQQLRLLK